MSDRDKRFTGAVERLRSWWKSEDNRPAAASWSLGDTRETRAILELADRVEKLEALPGIGQHAVETEVAPAEVFNIDFNVTEHGFRVAHFNDRYGGDCSIQKSSLAGEDCIWLGIHESRMHLTQGMAAALIPILAEFVETGEIGEATKKENG